MTYTVATGEACYQGTRDVGLTVVDARLSGDGVLKVTAIDGKPDFRVSFSLLTSATVLRRGARPREAVEGSSIHL